MGKVQNREFPCISFPPSLNEKVKRNDAASSEPRTSSGPEPPTRNLQPVDLARYYSVLIRKPLSCVIGHDIARYSAGSVLDLFSARQTRDFIHYRPLGR